VEDVFDLARKKGRRFPLVLGQQNSEELLGCPSGDMLCSRPTVLPLVGFLTEIARMIWQFDFHHHCGQPQSGRI